MNKGVHFVDCFEPLGVTYGPLLRRCSMLWMR